LITCENCTQLQRFLLIESPYMYSCKYIATWTDTAKEIKVSLIPSEVFKVERVLSHCYIVAVFYDVLLVFLGNCLPGYLNSCDDCLGRSNFPRVPGISRPSRLVQCSAATFFNKYLPPFRSANLWQFSEPASPRTMVFTTRQVCFPPSITLPVSLRHSNISSIFHRKLISRST
jgi:hypothetical protein